MSLLSLQAILQLVRKQNIYIAYIYVHWTKHINKPLCINHEIALNSKHTRDAQISMNMIINAHCYNYINSAVLY